MGTIPSCWKTTLTKSLWLPALFVEATEAVGSKNDARHSFLKKNIILGVNDHRFAEAEEGSSKYCNWFYRIKLGLLSWTLGPADCLIYWTSNTSIRQCTTLIFIGTIFSASKEMGSSILLTLWFDTHSSIVSTRPSRFFPSENVHRERKYFLTARVLFI